MKDTIISDETAKLAREKGLQLIPPITQSLLQKWLREEHNIYLEVRCVVNRMFTFHIVSHRYYSNKNWVIWEEALEAGLIEALKLIKL